MGAQGAGLARGLTRIAQRCLFIAGACGVVDQPGHWGGAARSLEQGSQDLRVHGPRPSDRAASLDRLPRQLVSEGERAGPGLQDAALLTFVQGRGLGPRAAPTL